MPLVVLPLQALLPRGHLWSCEDWNEAILVLCVHIAVSRKKRLRRRKLWKCGASFFWRSPAAVPKAVRAGGSSGSLSCVSSVGLSQHSPVCPQCSLSLRISNLCNSVWDIQYFTKTLSSGKQHFHRVCPFLSWPKGDVEQLTPAFKMQMNHCHWIPAGCSFCSLPEDKMWTLGFF